MSNEQDNQIIGAATRVGVRVAGGAAVFGAFFYLLKHHGDIDYALFGAFKFAFIGYFLGAWCALTFHHAKSAAYSQKNPFMQGVHFSFFILVCCLLTDLAILQGTFLFSPAIHLMTEGSLQGTYWSCDYWSFENEGFCTDSQLIIDDFEAVE